MSKETMLIGGLPAEKFVGRQIKVAWKDSLQHPTGCRCMEIDRSHNMVVVSVFQEHGKPRIDRVEAHRCKPWWSKNPDLKAEAEALGTVYNGEVSVGRAFDAAIQTAADSYKTQKPTAPMPPAPPAKTPEPPAPPKQDAEPPQQAATQEPLKSAAPRKLVRVEAPADGNIAWLDSLKEFYRVNESLAKAAAEIAKLQQAAADDRLMSDLLIEQLQTYGVTLIWADGKVDVPVNPTAPAVAPAVNPVPVAAPAALAKSGAPKRNRTDNRAFEASAKEWIESRNKPFGFNEVCAALGTTRSYVRNKIINNICDELFIASRVSGIGGKVTFYPKRK